MERGDHLSEILDFVEVRSAVSGGSVVEGRWRTASTIDNDLKFIAVVHGSARLQVDGVPEVVELGSGDVAVLNGRSWLKIEGGRVMMNLAMSSHPISPRRCRASLSPGTSTP